MGCVSSKLLSTTDLDQDALFFSDDPPSGDHRSSHVVSLISTTYGVLNLDRHESKAIAPETSGIDAKSTVVKESSTEIINALELMKDLGDETPVWSPMKPPPSLRSMSTEPAALSPKNQKTRFAAGKENSPLSPLTQGTGTKRCEASRVLRPLRSSENTQLKEEPPIPRSKKARDDDSIALLRSYPEKCPPGGENAVILYTTTLRGIRRTFEECNAVRSVIQSYDVKVVERDVSMDSGYREELRVLMERKEVRVPLVFVKGRQIGGADEVLRLDEGKLAAMLQGIPAAAAWCRGCAGVRFVMCMDCSGSCKVLDEEKKMVRCGECNENGLIHCPMCS